MHKPIKAYLVAILLLVLLSGGCYLTPEIDLSQNIPYKVYSLDEARGWVATQVDYVSDEVSHGYEHFQMPEETYRISQGDCEDQALLLMYFAHHDLGLPAYLQLVGLPGADKPSHAVADINGVWYEAIYGYPITDRSIYKPFRKIAYDVALREIYDRGYVVIF